MNMNSNDHFKSQAAAASASSSVSMIHACSNSSSNQQQQQSPMSSFTDEACPDMMTMSMTMTMRSENAPAILCSKNNKSNACATASGSPHHSKETMMAAAMAAIRANQEQIAKHERVTSNKKIKDSSCCSVQFNETVQEISSSSAALENVPKEDLWYPSSELSKFRKIAFLSALLCAQQQQASPSNNSNNNNNDSIDASGLERYSVDRSKLKALSRKCVIQAQQQYKASPQKADLICQVSLECSSWAHEAALMQGIQDYIQAHETVVPTEPATLLLGTSFQASYTPSEKNLGSTTRKHKTDDQNMHNDDASSSQTNFHADSRLAMILGLSNNNDNNDNNNNTSLARNKRQRLQ